MTELVQRLSPARFVPAEDRRAALLLLLAALLPAAQRYAGATTSDLAGLRPGTGLAPILPLFVSAFLFYGILPLLVLTLLFHQDVREYGLCLGDWRRGIRSAILLGLPAALLLLLPASRTHEMRSAYPLDREALHSVRAFVRLEAVRAGLFYLPWEFFFRGFLLFGLKPRVGAAVAICIQTIPSCLWHIGLPTGEVVSSVLGGIVLGALALRTRSILWPLLLHALIGASLDFWIAAAQ